MPRTTATVLFKAKSCLCIAVMLVVPAWTTSCGPASTSTSGETLIPLTPDHPLSQALKGSIFEGATALAVSPDAGSFRVVHPNKALTLKGRHTFDGATAAVSEFVIGREANLTTFAIDAHKRITTITANGQTWQRPAGWTSAADIAAPTTSEALMAANTELIEAANEIGQNGSLPGTTPGTNPGGTPGSVIPKQAASAQAQLIFLVLAPLAAVWTGLITAPITVPIALLITPLAFIVGATLFVIGAVTGVLPAIYLGSVALTAIFGS
jgi:hypothetical protein